MKSLFLTCLIFVNSIYAGLNDTDRAVKVAEFHFTVARFNRSLNAINFIRRERGNAPVYYSKFGCMIYGDRSDVDASPVGSQAYRTELSTKQALTGKTFILIKLTPEAVDEGKLAAASTNIKYITCIIDPKSATIGDLETQLDGIISF